MCSNSQAGLYASQTTFPKDIINQPMRDEDYDDGFSESFSRSSFEHRIVEK